LIVVRVEQLQSIYVTPMSFIQGWRWTVASEEQLDKAPPPSVVRFDGDQGRTFAEGPLLDGGGGCR